MPSDGRLCNFTLGSEYVHTDTDVVASHIYHYYKLEDVELDGTTHQRPI